MHVHPSVVRSELNLRHDVSECEWKGMSGTITASACDESGLGSTLAGLPVGHLQAGPTRVNG